MQGTQDGRMDGWMDDEETKSMERQLLEAAREGLLETVEQLLNQGLDCKQIDVNFQDEDEVSWSVNFVASHLPNFLPIFSDVPVVFIVKILVIIKNVE